MHIQVYPGIFPTLSNCIITTGPYSEPWHTLLMKKKTGVNFSRINNKVSWFIKINVNVDVFFTNTVSVTDQFWLISRCVTDWFCLISFSDSCSFFTAFFVVNSTLIVIIKRINKRLLFRVKHVFSANIWSNNMTHFSCLFKFQFYKLPFPTQHHSTRLWYNQSDIFKDFCYLVFIQDKK